MSFLFYIKKVKHNKSHLTVRWAAQNLSKQTSSEALFNSLFPFCWSTKTTNLSRSARNFWAYLLISNRKCCHSKLLFTSCIQARPHHPFRGSDHLIYSLPPSLSLLSHNFSSSVILLIEKPRI